MATIGNALRDDGVDTTLRMAEQAANPATPSAGYGRLFVKSNGVYFIDDAGSVTGPFAAAGAAVAQPHKFVTAPLGTTFPITSTTWVDIAAGTFDITLTEVQVGHVLELDTILQFSHSLTTNWMAALFAVNGVNDESAISLVTAASADQGYVLPARLLHTVVSADLVGGAVTVKPRVRVSGGTGTIHSDAFRRPQFSAKNLGPVQT